MILFWRNTCRNRYRRARGSPDEFAFVWIHTRAACWYKCCNSAIDSLIDNWDYIPGLDYRPGSPSGLPEGCHFTSNGNITSPVTFSAPVFQFSFFSRGLTWLTNHLIKTRGSKRKLTKTTISANRSEMPGNWKCSLPRRARKRSGQFINSSLFFCVIRACGRWKNRRKKTVKKPKANCRG